MANLWLGNHSQLPIKLATVKSDQLKSYKGDSFKVCFYNIGWRTTEVKTAVLGVLALPTETTPVIGIF
jgi:hypothetical protein